MVAIRAADLRPAAGPRLGKDGRTALTVARPGRIATGDLVVFLKPAAVAPAVVRRDGRVQAGGHPADHARLGLAEERLDELCGSPGVIDEIARTVLLDGKVKGAARRALTPALAIRLTLLMTLMPDADYAEVMAALLGDLPLVPWQRPYQVPTATVACTCQSPPISGPHGHPTVLPSALPPDLREALMPSSSQTRRHKIDGAQIVRRPPCRDQIESFAKCECYANWRTEHNVRI